MFFTEPANLPAAEPTGGQGLSRLTEKWAARRFRWLSIRPRNSPSPSSDRALKAGKGSWTQGEVAGNNIKQY